MKILIEIFCQKLIVSNVISAFLDHLANHGRRHIAHPLLKISGSAPVMILVLLDKNCVCKLDKERLYWATIVKWRENNTRSYAYLETLSIQLAILQFNFGWFIVSDCNWCFIRQKLSVKNCVVMVLLGNNGKITSHYELIRCLFKTPWHAVSDSWVQSVLIYFKLL